MIRSSLFGVALGMAGGMAWAGKPPAVAGDYIVELRETSNNCPNGGLQLVNKTLTIEQTSRSKQLKVLLPPTAIMRGSIDAKANVKARAKRGGTAIQGLMGEFDVAGSAGDAKVDFVLIGHYFTADKPPKPYCTQSWSVKGAKKTSARR